MNKILLTTAGVIFFGANVFGQGTLEFFASPGLHDGINVSTDGVTSIPYPTNGVAGFGTFNVSFFAAPSGTILTFDSQGLPNFAGWTAVPAIIGTTPLGNGTAFSASISLPIGAAGSPIELEAVAWSGADTSWAKAVQDIADDLLAFSGDTFNGTQEGALGWLQVTGASGPPTSVTSGSTAFNGLTLRRIATPEPSTYALGIFGAGVFVAFRYLNKKRKARIAAR